MAATAAGFAQAHRALLADPRIQFDLPAAVPPPRPEVPEWLKRLLHWLNSAKPPEPPRWLVDFFAWLARQGPAAMFVFWALVAVIAVTLLWLAARWLWRRRQVPEAEPDWRPDAAPARALLAEADALAARGDYAEAAHLVLLRSVEQIFERRPATVRPALTSRDIARVDGLPGDVARAFALIAGIVETGLFAARPVGAEAWAQARAAYEAVAFPKAWA